MAGDIPGYNMNYRNDNISSGSVFCDYDDWFDINQFKIDAFDPSPLIDDDHINLGVTNPPNTQNPNLGDNFCKPTLSNTLTHNIGTGKDPQRLISSSNHLNDPLIDQLNRPTQLLKNQVCHNCKTSKTPLWRRTVDKKNALCNACGLYVKQYGSDRPIDYIKKPARSYRSKGAVTFAGLQKSVEGKGDCNVTLSWSQLCSLVDEARQH